MGVTSPFERAAFYQATCTSTNDWAKNYLRVGLPMAEGTVFITSHQSQGRGQQGATWLSQPYQNLTFSILLYPSFLGVSDLFALNMMTSLAIYDVLATYLPQRLSIKWPNDSYYGNKKLGGLLIEPLLNQRGAIKGVVIGIGLNVNQGHFELPQATSLKIILQREFPLSPLLDQIVNSLGKYYHQLQDQGSNSLLPHYLKHLYKVGKLSPFQDCQGPFQGTMVGIHPTGLLAIQKKEGNTTYYNPKEIAFLPSSLA